MSDEHLKKGLWICAGQRLASNSKLAQLWRPLKEGGEPNQDEAYLFQKKGIASNIVGGVFEITYDDSNGGMTVKLGGDQRPKFLHMHDDQAYVDLCRLAQEKDQADYRLYRKEQAALNDKHMAALDPIAKLYSATHDSVGRALIIGAVVRYITDRRALDRSSKK